MGVVDLKAERRKRRPQSRQDELMAAAEVLAALRMEAEDTLFVDSATVMHCLRPVISTIVWAARQEAARRTS